MARRIAAVGRVTVSERRSTAPSSAADGFSVSIAYISSPWARRSRSGSSPEVRTSAAQHLRDEERQFQRLTGVQPGVTGGLVPAGEVRVADLHRPAEALGDVLTGELDV